MAGPKQASKTPKPIRQTISTAKLKPVDIRVEQILHPIAAAPNHSFGGKSFIVIVAGTWHKIYRCLSIEQLK